VINYKTDEDAVKDSETTELEHTILVEKTSAVEESSHDTLMLKANLRWMDLIYYDEIKQQVQGGRPS